MATRPARLPLLSLLLLLAIGSGFAQTAELPTTPQTIAGSVTDAATGQPVFRALVRLNGASNRRAMLTDVEGHFSFAEVIPSNDLILTATKPGYSFSRSPGDSAQLFFNAGWFTGPVALDFYPEAILKGTVLGSSGEALSNIQITAFRNSSDEFGQHWSYAAHTRSNEHGQFRMPVIAGDYRIESAYLASGGSIVGTGALLPATAPEPSADVKTLHVAPGEQLEADLHPPRVPLVEIDARVDLNLQEVSTVTAILPNGTSFPVNFNRASPQGASQAGNQTGDPAEIHLRLPPGSYVLQARRRNFGADSIDQATVNIAPAQLPVTLSLHFSPIAPIPVEIAVDDASTAAAEGSGQALTPPNSRSLNLFLDSTISDASVAVEAIRPVQRAGEPMSLVAPPGSYRLRAQPGFNWYIASATYGGADLLSHELLVTPGTGSSPLYLVVSNQVASVSGTLTLDGAPIAGWIYFLASTPTATPVLAVRSSDNGYYNEPFLPPGSYRVLAFTHRSPSPGDPKMLAAFPTRIAALTVNAGDKPVLNLQAVPDSEVRP